MPIYQLILHLLCLVVLPPLFLGIIVKVKAAFAGRTGAPLLQLYYDLFKLVRKDVVLSTTTTWLFRAGPIVGLVTTVMAGCLVPLGYQRAPVAFMGDLVLFAYLFGLGRFFTVLVALDTGSSFEGMGAAREVTFACLAEPALFLGLIVLARCTSSLTLSTMLSSAPSETWRGVSAPSCATRGRSASWTARSTPTFADRSSWFCSNRSGRDGRWSGRARSIRRWSALGPARWSISPRRASVRSGSRTTLRISGRSI